MPVAPVGGGSPKRGPRAPVIAVLAVGTVLVGGVVLAGLYPADSPRPPVEPSTPVVSASPDQVLTPRVPARRVTASQLAAGIADGSLDGWVVYADATLRTRCRSDATNACTPDLSIDGLAVDVVQAASIAGEPAPVPPASLLVLGVRGHRLDYLGSLIVDPAGSPSLDRLTAEAPVAPDPFARQLHDVRGWLVAQPCDDAASAAPSCAARPFLADEPPPTGAPSGTSRGAPVLLAPAVWGVDRTATTVSPGPFLVRETGWAAVPWQVVARYDPSHSVRVVIP